MEWIKVEDRLPGPEFVLAVVRRESGKLHRLRAMYAAKHTMEGYTEDDFAEYDEKTDAYYLPEGWYEQNDYEETHWAITDPVTHWMPLPEPPE